MAGLGDCRCPVPDTCRHRSRSGRMVSACQGTPGQARRARPGAVLIGKRCDTLLPVTAVTGTGQASKATGDSTARPSRGQPGGMSVGARTRSSARLRTASCWERVGVSHLAVP